MSLTNSTDEVNSTEEEKSGTGRILVLVGFFHCNSIEQKICHISLERKNTANFIFSTPTQMRSESAACVINNNLYIVGVGWGSNELWKWIPERDEWTRLADLPSYRRRHSATYVGEKIYVLGDWVYADERTGDSVLCYDINSNNWTRGTQLCHAVLSAACVTYKLFIYVFGGVDKDGEVVNHVQVYDTSTDEVTLSSNPMPAAQGLMRAVLWRSKALLIGCWTCYIYDFELNSWVERERFKAGVIDFGLTLNNDTLYISGRGMYRRDENNKWIRTFSDEVKSLSVDDFISDNPEAEWELHNKLPFPALVGSFNEYGIERDMSRYPVVDAVYVNVELNGEMRGMTVVDDRLFVVPSGDPVVNVYNPHGLKPLYAVYIPDMKDPQDLASCSRNKVLYISDAELECIHRVIISGGHLNQWRVREGFSPYGLCVTSECNLIVTLDIKLSFQKRARPIILEYSTDGQMLREITYNSSIEQVSRIVEFSRDQFLICGSHGLFLINLNDQIIRSYNKSNIRNENLEIHYCGVDKKRELLYVVDWNKDRIEMLNFDMALVGYIPVKPSSRLYFDSSSDQLFIDASTRRLTQNPRGEIKGLTVVDDQLFVLHEKHESQVNVYDSYKMKALEPINVESMRLPRHLIGCSYNKALYISDLSQCIHRVSIRDLTVKKWRIRGNFRPRGISLTSKHNALIALNSSSDDPDVRRYRETNRVAEYTTEGQLLREILYDTRITDVCRVLEWNIKQLLICHESCLKFTLINSEGKIIRTYDELTELNKGLLGSPPSIVLDRKREILFVADETNNRVMMFSSDMTLLGEVQTSRQLSSPSHIHFDSSSDRLFVGEWPSGRVIICPLRHQLMKLDVDIASALSSSVVDDEANRYRRPLEKLRRNFQSVKNKMFKPKE